MGQQHKPHLCSIKYGKSDFPLSHHWMQLLAVVLFPIRTLLVMWSTLQIRAQWSPNLQKLWKVQKSSELHRKPSKASVLICTMYMSMLFNTQLKILSHSCSFALCVCLLDCKIVSECQFWKILSSQVLENFNSNFNKGVWFQHNLQNLVAFVTTCKRAILWIYGHVFPVVILILGSLPHCVSSDLYWSLNAIGKAQGAGLHSNKDPGGRPKGGAQIWKSLPQTPLHGVKTSLGFL